MDSARPVPVPGFADHHAHLLRTAAGVPFPANTAAVREFHQRVAAQGSTPMDVLDPPLDPPGLGGVLRAALARAARCGLVEITEMGMRSWDYLEALGAVQEAGPLPVRVRVYLASGLAGEASLDELDARRAPLVLGPAGRRQVLRRWLAGAAHGRPVCRLHRRRGRGLLFTDEARLARRIAPLADRGWRIAIMPSATGRRRVLDAYELALEGDRAAMAAAGPRIEHASVLSADLIARIAGIGVTPCIHPRSRSPTRGARGGPRSGPGCAGLPVDRDAAAGERWWPARYPIEVLEPLVGLAEATAGRSDPPGFSTADPALGQAIVPVGAAFAMMTDGAACEMLVSADPRTTPGAIDAIDVTATAPALFWPG